MTAPVAERAVISDDGRETQLALYDEAGVIATVTLSPQRAISLAGELISAASRRLDVVLASRDAPRHRRGGDRQAGNRAERDAALRELAALVSDGTTAEHQARAIAGQLARYRPMTVETKPERLLMRKVIDSDLVVPKPDRLARIIRSR
jgi:hypothetical protein